MNSLIKEKITQVIDSKTKYVRMEVKKKFLSKYKTNNKPRTTKEKEKFWGQKRISLSQWSTCDYTVMHCNNTVYYKAKCPYFIQNNKLQWY